MNKTITRRRSEGLFEIAMDSGLLHGRKMKAERMVWQLNLTRC